MRGAAPVTGQHALHKASHHQHARITGHRPVCTHNIAPAALAMEICSVAILHKPLCAKIPSRLRGPMGSESGDDLADITDAGSEIETAPNDNDNESLSDSPELMCHGCGKSSKSSDPVAKKKGLPGTKRPWGQEHCPQCENEEWPQVESEPTMRQNLQVLLQPRAKVAE